MKLAVMIAVMSGAVLGAHVTKQGAKNPNEIAGSRLGITKAEVLTNAATAPAGYGNVRQGLPSVSFLVASSEVVLNEQGVEFGSVDLPVKSKEKDKTTTGTTAADKAREKDAAATGPEFPAGTLTKSVYKTFYFDKFDRVVAIQMSFENLNSKELDDLLKALDDKYSKDIQKKTDVYTFTLSATVKMECRVSGTAFRGEQAIRFRAICFYYDASRMEKMLRDVNQRNAIKFSELI